MYVKVCELQIMYITLDELKTGVFTC